MPGLASIVMQRVRNETSKVRSERIDSPISFKVFKERTVVCSPFEVFAIFCCVYSIGLRCFLVLF